MTRLHLLTCIQAAQRAGFTHYAAALLKLYRKEFPERPEPSPRISQ